MLVPAGFFELQYSWKVINGKGENKIGEKTQKEITSKLKFRGELKAHIHIGLYESNTLQE